MNEIGIKNEGFTFLEVMVSLCMIAIAFISVYKMQSQSIRMATAAGFYSTAPFLAQQKLAELDAFTAGNRPFAENAGSFKGNFTGYGWQTRIEEVHSEVLGAQTSQDLKKIVISVYSKDDEKSYQLTAYRFLRTENS